VGRDDGFMFALRGLGRAFAKEHAGNGEPTSSSGEGGVAVSKDADAIPDSSSSSSSGGDGDASLTSDAPANGDPCSESKAILGRADILGSQQDVIPPGAVDAYHFKAPAAGVARCLWVYVDGAPPSKKVRVSVYKHDPSTSHPLNLVAQVEMTNVVGPAWNKKALTSPITVKENDQLWLGISPVASGLDGGLGFDNIAIRYSSGPQCSEPFMHAMGINGTGPLPSVFNPDTTYEGDCNGAVYLGP